MSSVFATGVLAVAGVFTLALGVVHLWIPRIFRFDRAIGRDEEGGPALGDVGVGDRRYALRRADAQGLAWVMSNAASLVLISVGLVDLAWLTGWRAVPLGLGAAWIAVWWAVRAVSQLAVGRRPVDWAFVAWFGALGAAHLFVAGTAA
jgi:hypothetical protein